MPPWLLTALGWQPTAKIPCTISYFEMKKIVFL
jgi:hypothetical protein